MQRTLRSTGLTLSLSLSFSLGLAGCPSDGNEGSAAEDAAMPDSGGMSGTGGNSGSGGSASTGGNSGTGGRSGSGGAEASGGSTGTGGTSAPERPFSGNGISAIVDGTEITYSESFTLFPNNSGDGVLRFEAMGTDVLMRWRIFVPSVPGTYPCDGTREDALVQHIAGSNPQQSVASGETAENCTITLTQYEPNGILAGTFSGDLVSGGPTAPLVSVTDGVFYYDPYSPPSNMELGSGSGASFELGGDIWSYDQAVATAQETYVNVTVSPSDRMSPGFPQGIQLATIPNETGTHNCGDGPSYRAVNVWFWWKGDWYYAGNRASDQPDGPAGSSCSITLDEVGTIDGLNYSGSVAGSFSGTFVTSDESKSIVVSNGKFRL